MRLSFYSIGSLLTHTLILSLDQHQLSKIWDFFGSNFHVFENCLSERKLEARLCVTIELISWTLLASAWHPSYYCWSSKRPFVSWRLKCISLLFPTQVGKSYWTVPLSVKFKACPHVGGKDQLTLVSLQCTGKASAGEVGQRNTSGSCRGLEYGCISFKPSKAAFQITVFKNVVLLTFIFLLLHSLSVKQGALPSW